MKIKKLVQQYHWTKHINTKMRYYRLSPQRIKRIIRSPQRMEAGVAPETIAVMQRADRGKKKEEIWVMYQEKEKGTKILISAWRYLGVSPQGKELSLPPDVLEDLKIYQEEGNG